MQQQAATSSATTRRASRQRCTAAGPGRVVDPGGEESPDPKVRRASGLVLWLLLWNPVFVFCTLCYRPLEITAADCVHSVIAL